MIKKNNSSSSPAQWNRVSLSIEYFFEPKEIHDFIGEKRDHLANPLLCFSGKPFLEALPDWFNLYGHVFNFRFSADEAFFYPINPKNVWDRRFSEENLNAWINAVTDWIPKFFGEEGLSAFYCPPEKEFGLPSIDLWIGEKLLPRKFFGRQNGFWTATFIEYGKALAGLGLAPPKIPQKPTADEISRYCKASRSNEELSPISERDLKKYVRLPDWTPDPDSEESLKAHASEAVALTFENARDLVEDLNFQIMAVTSELERIKRLNYLKKSRMEPLEKDLRKLYPLVEPYLGVTAAAVLVSFFKATLESDDPKDQDYFVPPDKGFYRLKDGRLIEVDYFDWWEPATGLSGSGAINLIESLSEYDEKGAIVGLLGLFTVKETLASLAYHEAVAPKDWTEEVLAAPFELPKTMESTWPPVRDYLMEEFKFPAKVLDEAHETGRLLTNHLGLMIFPCDREAGMFYMFPQNISDKLPEAGHPWGDCPPFVLKGSGGAVYLTDHPLEALALKSLYPESSIIAVGEKSTAESVRPYVTGQEAKVAVRPKNHGHRLARQLKELDLPIFKVPSGQSFTEFWRNGLRGER